MTQIIIFIHFFCEYFLSLINLLICTIRLPRARPFLTFPRRSNNSRDILRFAYPDKSINSIDRRANSHIPGIPVNNRGDIEISRVRIQNLRARIVTWMKVGTTTYDESAIFESSMQSRQINIIQDSSLRICLKRKALSEASSCSDDGRQFLLCKFPPTHIPLALSIIINCGTIVNISCRSFSRLK